MTWLDASAIHDSLAGRWPEVLTRLGVPEECLRNRHGPCPVCGGRDRFRFDDKAGRGTFFCNGCGSGDAFRLLQLVHGCDFSAARRMVIDAMDLDRDAQPPRAQRRQPQRDDQAPAKPTARVRDLLRATAAPEAVQDAIDYLDSRSLWPLPDGCSWRAHAGAEYWHERKLIGRFPALVAEVRDIDDERVSAHLTYLQAGRKLDLENLPARKLLSKLTGRRGCAVRLMPLDGETLGVAEGIETALAAHRLHGMPVWPTLNAVLLAKFEPPPGVWRIVTFADRDVAGIEAAYHLRESLDGRATVELRLPPARFNDWAEAWEARHDR